MERRVLLAFLLSFGVFLLFVRFFGPQPEPPGEADPATETAQSAPFSEQTATPAATPPPAATADDPVATDAAADPAATTPALPPVEVREAAQEQVVTVGTRFYEAEFTNRGGRLLSLELREHTDSLGNPYQAIPQGDELVMSVRPLDVFLPSDPSPGRLVSALHEVSVDGQLRESGPVGIEVRDGETSELEFRWTGADGLEVVKTVRILGGEYRMEGRVSVQRGGAEQVKEVLYGPGIGDEEETGNYLGEDQGVLKTGSENQLYSVSSVQQGGAEVLSAQAVGVASHYFAGLLVTDPGQRYSARLESLAIPWDSFATVPEDASGNRDLLVGRLGSAGPSSFTLFAGPKQVELLAEIGVDIVEFGAWLRFLVVPIRTALLWSYDRLGNYGWAIVFVTILISLLLAPLKHYSYVSIRRMQKISPQIKRVQDRYRSLKPTDPKRREMNQEMVALYREHNVSPIGGCLPMLLMIPFFFAFYRLLVVSVELRHAPFIFWVQDLSTEDPLFILPVLMGLSQFVMQKMTATQAEGIQAKIMLLMPFVFMLILMWAPSGLVLYWFANNLISMGQQAITIRIMNRRDEAAKQLAAASKGKKGRKSAGQQAGAAS